MSDEEGNKKKILVVEDEPSISEVCQRALISDGYDVDIAANGAVAQQMLEQECYDLCLIDIRTPMMNGQELYQHIIEKCPKLAPGVIFATGDVITGNTQGFLELSGRPFLLKPFTIDELITTVGETARRIQ